MDNEQLRPAFESYARANGLILIRNTNGNYNIQKTQAAWKAFQAAFNLYR
ncbi:hypothetical protein LVJ85_05720 [Neisseria sp. Dent CA1/247]|nr:hypothetical protein [Neisseria sp. Dent CA1/247]UOO77960.1 hypothetical protein LVJ85_05720 [Neisseria sp. Dent CA1/247]